MKRFLPVFLLFLSSVPCHAQRVENPVAEFAGLDKITARITKFDVRINETVQFGALQVTPRICYNRATSEDPLTTGFVEVNEVTLKNEVRRIFDGWMFADSPGLNAVEHPIYDIWLVECKGGKAPAQAKEPATGEEEQQAEQAKKRPREQKRPGPIGDNEHARRVPQKPPPPAEEPFNPFAPLKF